MPSMHWPHVLGEPLPYVTVVVEGEFRMTMTPPVIPCGSDPFYASGPFIPEATGQVVAIDPADPLHRAIVGDGLADAIAEAQARFKTNEYVQLVTVVKCRFCGVPCGVRQVPTNAPCSDAYCDRPECVEACRDMYTVERPEIEHVRSGGHGMEFRRKEDGTFGLWNCEKEQWVPLRNDGTVIVEDSHGS